MSRNKSSRRRQGRGKELAGSHRVRLGVEVLEDRTLLTAVTLVYPTSNLVGVGVSDPVRVVFDTALNAATVNGSTFQLVDASNHSVGAQVTYDPTTNTATLTPSAPLGYSSAYTVTVVGGSGGVKDTQGNPLAANDIWSFTTQAPPAQVGQWSQPSNMPIVTTAVALLPTGKVLGWAGADDGGGSATLWDPKTGIFTAVPDPISNIFCSGFSLLPDGRLLVVGGYNPTGQSLGIPVAEIFDPNTLTWTQASNMAYARWYATVTTLPNGHLLVSSGSGTNETQYIPTPEDFNPATNSFTQLTQATATFDQPNYPFMMVLPNGQLLDAGSDEVDGTTFLPTPTMQLNYGTQTWTTVDPNPIGSASAVQYAPGLIMRSGSPYSEVNPNLGAAAATTYVMNALQPGASWQQTASMNYARGFENLTVLPTGQVLATGGENNLDGVTLADAVYPAEMWNPTTQTWTTLASNQVPRLYHSVGLLLPDGTVLVSGGGKDFGMEQANESNMEIYSPAYLFQGARPTITAAPATAQYGSSFFVQTPDAANITSVSLVGLGADTHSFNFNQRFVPLSFTQTAGGLMVNAPVDANLAPPGSYMLFINNSLGVPSVASFIQFSVPPAGNLTPLRASTTALTSTAVTATFNQAMNAASINAGTFEVLDPSGHAVAGTVTYNATTQVATFVPVSPLRSATTYTAVFLGGSGTTVQYANGTALASNFSWSFTTAPLVAAVSPAGGTTLANPQMNVTARFNAPINPATLTTSTFELFDSSGNPVAGRVQYDAANQTAIFIPNAALNQSSTYTATLVGGSSGNVLTDAVGNPLAASYSWSSTTRSSAPNPIVAENQLAGTAKSVWDNVSGSGDPNLQGFTDNISYNVGQTVNFKVSTISSHYRIDIYRLGYYQGNGAALKGSVDVNLPQAQVQPAPATDVATGLIDYGTWHVSASWQIPTAAVSGVYVADLVGEDGKTTTSQIVFVVRNDASTSDILFQTDDTTWQAYNTFGGNSLYGGSGPGGPYGSEGSTGRAYAVSYNRPLDDRGIAGGSGDSNQVFWGEYPMISWLEQNGYNVSYFTGIDAARYGSLIPQHDIYLTAGHDEYWSGVQQANVTAARDAGVNLAFFTGNDDYWKTRLLDAIDGTLTSNRTLVSYKETLGTDGVTAAKIDPLPDIWTGTWRDPSFSPPADGGRPENALSGTLFTANRGLNFPGDPIQVPALYAQNPIWANTAVAALQPGQVWTSAPNLLGYEWNSDLDNGFRPAGLVDLSSTTQNIQEMLLNNGSLFGPGTATNSQTLYRADSGALVFSAGTVQWSWGLSGVHDGGPSATDPVIQQATVNLLGEMGAQAATLQAGLVPASPLTGRTTPTSTITSVGTGLSIRTGYPVTVTGTATASAGGVVAGVEVSVDGGKTWHPAVGHDSWSYTWTPTTAGSVTVLSRATSGNNYTEVPGPGVTVTVLQDSTTPPQIVNVQAAVVNNQTVTITWTTDENATSQVLYGTSPTSLSGSVNSSAMVTAHSITLTGLTPDSLYYYRVVSVDQYGHTTTAPASSSQPSQFSTPAFTDTGVAGFGAGQTGPGTYITQEAGGAVILAPAVAADFSGTSLPATWFSTPWSTGGVATVANNLLTVDGARAGTSATYGPGRSLEFTATFSGAPYQIAGFGVDYSSAPWAAFSTGAGGALYAITANGTSTQNTLIPGNWLAAPHDFRIDWTATAVNYSIDGILVASSPLVITGSMRPLASDLTPGGGTLAVNWMHLTPYATSGTYLSRVLDAGQAVTWTLFSDAAVTPPGTSIALRVRMGNTATPDSTWTDFIPVSGPGAIVGGTSRYLQYQAVLTTTNPGQTPVLENVALSYNNNPGSDTYPPTVLSISPASGASSANPAAPLVVKFSELMNAATISGSTIQLFAAGSITPAPATVTYAGSTATLQPSGLLLSGVQYQLVISGSLTDAAGNALGSNVTATFTTGPAGVTDTAAADFGAGTTGSGSYVSQTGDGEVILAPATGTEFSGTALPAGWFASTASGGSGTVGGGLLTADGALVGTTQYFGPGTSLQFAATFSGDPYQHVGLGTDFNGAPWAIFSTGGGGALYARTNSGSSSQDILLPGSWLGSKHVFRIDWASSGVTYYIDGTQVATSSIAITGAMRPLVDDNTAGGGVITVDWARLAPYAASGAFVSRVFDAGQAVTWQSLSWAGQTPAGTGLALAVRMGNSATPDGTWTDWVPLAASGAVIGGSARYLQYQATLTTSNPNLTPELDSVTASYAANLNTTAPKVVSITPAAGATGVSPAAPVVVKFSELMNAATITGSTIQLFAAGSTTPVAATVTLAGSTATLTPSAPLQTGTQYQVVVSGSITDSSGNALGSNVTSTFTTVASLTVTDTTSSDFGAGTTGPGTYVSHTSDGEVILAPALGAEFSGTALPAGWSVSTSSGGTATVAGGLLTVDGALAGATQMFGPGTSLQFAATFSGDPYQHAGLGTDMNGSPWAIFSTMGGGALYARTNSGSSSQDILLPGSWLGSEHVFRIDWTSTGFTYYIDGNQVASSSVAITSSMRPLADDFTTGGGTVQVDWARVAPYAASGAFVSRIFDAGAAVTWQGLSWAAQTPAGPGLSLAVRMGNSATPDGTWTDWVPLAASGAVIGGSARYLQYQATLTTSNPNLTPELDSVTASYVASPDTIAPKVVSITPAAGATNIGLSAPVVVKFSELMNAATITGSTVQLFVAGSSTPLQATVTFAGSTATLTPTAPLQQNTQYQVVVSGSITDSSGNALGSNVTSTFTTVATLALTDATIGNFDAGSMAGTYVPQTGNAKVILAPTLGAEFGGTALPAGWSVTSSGGSATVANGILTVDGALVGTTQYYGPGTSLQFAATFSGDPYQHVGLGTDMNGAPWAIFSTMGGGALYARTNSGSSSQDILLAGSWLGSQHVFRIDWASTGVTYYIDGNQVASSSVAITASMRPLVDDFTAGGGTVSVAWVRLAPYAASGTFVSRVFDGGQAVTWQGLSWAGQTPAGTGLALAVRMGNTASPDGTWTDWVPLAVSGAVIGGSARYLQYQATLSTSNPNLTAELDSVTINYSNTPDTVAPTIVSISPAAGSTGANLSAPVVVKFSELMNAATISGSTIQLFVTGSSTPVAATVTFSGSTATLTPAVPLLGSTQYQVVISGSITDSSGNALGSNVTAIFTTGLGQWSQAGVAAFSGGTLNGTALTTAGGGGVQLASGFSDQFTGTSLSSAWTTTSWAPAGGGPTSVTVSGGILSVAGAEVLSAQTFTNVPIQASVNFAAAPYQHFGLATDLGSVSGNYWAMFSTAGTTNTLFARVNASGVMQDVSLGALPVGFHTYEVQPTASGFQFYVDGTLEATINITFPANTPLHIAASSFGASPLQVDWVQALSYQSTGTFTSTVFNAGRVADWATASWVATLPAGTSITVLTRSGNTATPDSSWSAWAAVANGGLIASPDAQYMQYEVILTTTDPTVTPTLWSILFTWS
jgi:hypothetical protein